MRRPRPHGWKANALESFSQIMHQCGLSFIFFSCIVFDSLHIQQSLPHSALPLLHFVHPWHPIQFDTFVVTTKTSHTRMASHQRIIVNRSAAGCSLVTFFGLWNQDEHPCANLLRPSPTLLHLLPRIQPHLPLFLSSNPTELLDENNRTPLLSLPCNSLWPSPIPFPFTSAFSPPNSSTLHFSTACLLGLLSSCHIASTLPFLLLLTSGQRFGIFFLLQNLHSSSPRRWFGEFVQKTYSSSSCTLDHTTNQLLVLLLLDFMQPTVPSHHDVLPSWWEPRFLQSAASNSLTHQLVRVHSAF